MYIKTPHELFDEGRMHLSNGELNRAKSIFNKLILKKHVFDFTSGCYVNLATILLNETDDLENAQNEIERYLFKALEIKPSNAIAPASLTMLYTQLYEFDKASYWIEKCTDEEGIWTLMMFFSTFNIDENSRLISIQRAKLFNTDNTKKFFEKVIFLFNDNYMVRFNIAQIFLRSGDKGLLLSYNMFSELTRIWPENPLSYMGLCEICGVYLNKPYEAEEYLKKSEKLLRNIGGENECKKHRGFLKSLSAHIKIAQEKFEDALKITSIEIIENPNSTMLHNHALALYYLGRYDDSIKFCEKELFIVEDESTYVLLGMNYFELQEFEESLKYYVKALNFIKECGASFIFNDINEDPIISFRSLESTDDWLEKIYLPIIECNFRLGDYTTAKAMWMLADKELPKNSLIKPWANIIDTMSKSEEQIDNVMNRYNEIRVTMENERAESYNKNNIMRKWATDLMKIQTDDDLEPSKVEKENDWEKFEKQMDEILEKLKEEIKSKPKYEKMKKEFKLDFYELETKSIDFLSTAEYLYEINKNETIDFAPIMVEYCKIIELELQKLLGNSTLMLGQSLTNIDKFNIQPLKQEIEELNEIYFARNGSAHTGVSTQAKVERVRDIIFDKGLLNRICEIKAMTCNTTKDAN